MPLFVFEAKSLTGQNLRGQVEAQNEAEVRIKLRAQKLIPVKIVSKGVGAKRSSSFAGRVKPKDLQIFTRQFATLLASGIPVVQSLEALARSTGSKSLGNVLNRVVEDLGQGKRLGEAFSKHPNAYDTFYVNMVKAGEEGGVLDTVLNRMAEYIEKSVKIISKIKGAMVYPAAVIAVAVIVITVIMVFVIPKFESLFSGLGQDLPALTQYVVAASRFMQTNFIYIFLGGIGSVFGLLYSIRTPSGKVVFDKIIIDTPLIGNVIQKGGIARFARTLSTLLSAGVGIMDALEIAAKTSNNVVLEASFMRAREAISQGKSMTVTLAKEKHVPIMVTQMIGVGEQTGALDQMLSKVADFYEDEVDNAVNSLTAAMEPLLMVVLGGIVGTLVIAMYLPIFKMAGAISGN